MSQHKIRMGDVVVLLPGITGCRLQKGGVDIWPPTLGAVAHAVVGSGCNFEELKLEGDDYKVEDLGDGVKATGIISDITLIPGLIKNDIYAKLSAMIVENFEVIRASEDEEVNDHTPANFFEFSYDWRRDNRTSALRLERLIGCRLRQWRQGHNPKAKVILIAHSMGGLIARYYLEVLGGWETCKALITLGTPHRGSLKALNYLANGFRKFRIDMTEVARSFTSLYQLLPIYRAVKGDGEYQRVAELDIPGIDKHRAQEALSFHQEIIDAVNTNLKRPEYLSGGYANLPVVGAYQPTLQSAELSGGKLTASERIPEYMDELLWHGDGTVPYLSAVPHELSNAHRNSFYAEAHGELQRNDEVLNFLYNQLWDMQVKGMEDILGARPASTRIEGAVLSVSLEDLYFADEPVAIGARVLEGGREIEDAEQFLKHVGGLEATIEPLDPPGVALTVPFELKGNGWLLVQEGLPPGVYRAKVRTRGRAPLSPHPIQDLFQVAARS